MADTVPEQKTALLQHEALEAAWLAWRPGAPATRWHEFLPGPGQPVSPEAVFLLFQLDIEFRAKAGLPGLLQEQHFRHPRVCAGKAGLGAERQVDLVHWEYQQRWKRGRRACRADYVAGLPELALPLRQMQVLWGCPQCGRKGIVLEDDHAEQVSCPDCQALHAVSELFPLHPWAGPTGPAEEEVLPVRLGRYRITAKLGKGGFGVVYKGYDDDLRRDVAIKVPHRHRVAEPEGRTGAAFCRGPCD
jgi:hypothetical protein